MAISGVDAPLGVDSQRGVEIALHQHGDLLGHALDLRPEDDQCSAEGGQAAANLVTGDPTIAAVVGTSCSAAAFEAAPIISGAGYTMVSPSNTHPGLTAPGTHEAGYLRVSWNDRDQAAAMADFLDGQGVPSSVVIDDGGLFSVALGDAFDDAFDGATLARLSANPDGSDADVVIAAAARYAPGVLYMPVFQPLGDYLVAEARSLDALDDTLLAASDGLGYQDFVDDTWPASEGMFFTGPDTSFMDTRAYRRFARAYFREYHEEPLTIFSPFAFDAANVILSAIEAVGVIDGDGTLHAGRQALRDALFATSGFVGLTGTITCNPLGDCATVGFVILTVQGGQIVPVP